MSKYLLSVLIPARNELFLARTVEDIIENSNDFTEVILVCDGNWPDPPVQDHPRVTMIYHSESIGQRAATNEAAKLSRAKYVMKCDAHCSFAKDFDKVLVKDMQNDWTMVPVMKNLHAFDWVCPDGHRRYQSPSGPCTQCGKPTTRDIIWFAKNNPQSTSYLFDSEPHFQYFKDFKNRDIYKYQKDNFGLTETMSLQGSCWMLTRDKYFELDVCDEGFGSWGSQGIEIAVKTWLSGGRVIVNHKTSYGHQFRTQGGDFGFPYQLSGRQVQHAKKRSKEIFFKNKWPKQVRNLSWLLKKFWPVPGWTEEELVSLSMADLPGLDSGNYFFTMGNMVSPTLLSIANRAPSWDSDLFRREWMSIITMGLPTVDISNCTETLKHMFPMEDQFQMGGITAEGTFTNMMENRSGRLSSTILQGLNKPSVDKPMDKSNISHKSDISIAIPISSTVPDPTSCGITNINLGENSINNISGQSERLGEILTSSHKDFLSAEVKVHNGEKFSIVYYTDCRGDIRILDAVRKQIDLCRNGNEVISVSLKPVKWGKNIVLNLERSVLTMFKQILAGIEACTNSQVFLCEHDVLYHPSHFEFVPPKDDVFYYDENRWFVDLATGRALFYHACSTSLLVANRELLVEHYRKRVERVEKEGFTLRLGYEPGNHPYPRGVDFYTRATYFAKCPSIDIRHGKNLTPSRWSKEQFRNKRNLYAWTEKSMHDDLPGWGKVEDVIRIIKDE